MRIKWIDILKFIAIFFVVLGHTLNGGVIQTYIYSFHIPLFFFISGYLFTYKKSFKEFSLKKFKSLIIPYICFGIISILIYKFLGTFASELLKRGDISTNILTNLKGLIYGSAKTGLLKYNLPLWFLPCLFVTNILFYFNYKIFKNKSILFVPLIFAIIGYIINYHTNIKCLPFALETSITMLVFFSIGFIYKQYIEKKELKNKSYYALLIFLLIGGIIGILNGRIRYSNDVYNNIILFYISSISSIIGFITLSKLIKHNKYMEYIGKKTLGILVIHKFPIVFFQAFVFKTLMENNNILIGTLVTFISIAISLICDYIIIKWLPFLYGKWYKE